VLAAEGTYRVIRVSIDWPVTVAEVLAVVIGIVAMVVVVRDIRRRGAP
jgi:hypothetical protein